MFAYIDDNGEWVFDISEAEAIERLSNGFNVWQSETPDGVLIQIHEYEQR